MLLYFIFFVVVVFQLQLSGFFMTSIQQIRTPPLFPRSPNKGSSLASRRKRKRENDLTPIEAKLLAGRRVRLKFAGSQENSPEKIVHPISKKMDLLNVPKQIGSVKVKVARSLFDRTVEKAPEGTTVIEKKRYHISLKSELPLIVQPELSIWKPVLLEHRISAQVDAYNYAFQAMENLKKGFIARSHNKFCLSECVLDSIFEEVGLSKDQDLEQLIRALGSYDKYLVNEGIIKELEILALSKYAPTAHTFLGMMYINVKEWKFAFNHLMSAGPNVSTLILLYDYLNKSEGRFSADEMSRIEITLLGKSIIFSDTMRGYIIDCCDYGKTNKILGFLEELIQSSDYKGWAAHFLKGNVHKMLSQHFYKQVRAKGEFFMLKAAESFGKASKISNELFPFLEHTIALHQTEQGQQARKQMKVMCLQHPQRMLKFAQKTNHYCSLIELIKDGFDSIVADFKGELNDVGKKWKDFFEAILKQMLFISSNNLFYYGDWTGSLVNINRAIAISTSGVNNRFYSRLQGKIVLRTAGFSSDSKSNFSLNSLLCLAKKSFTTAQMSGDRALNMTLELDMINQIKKK